MEDRVMPNYINYVSLAGHQVDYLMAIASASLTVLTLIMAFDKKPQNSSMQPLLICSLVVAIVASFIGIHQFSGISSMEGADSLIDKVNLGVQDYKISYVNLLISENFFLMAMLLLIPAYDPDSACYVRNLLAMIFGSIILVQISWTLEEVFLIMDQPKEACLLVALALIIGISTFLFQMIVAKRKLANGEPSNTAFYICILVSISSIISEMINPKGYGMINEIELYYCTISSSLVYSSIGCVGWIGLSDVSHEINLNRVDFESR
jgi:glycerol uptake facilitator-like aquaporin